MKLVTVLILILGIFFTSTFAVAQDPIPIHAMMQNAGANPVTPPALQAGNDTAASLTQPAHPAHRTNGGKAMIVGGVVLLAAGAAVVTIDALSANTLGTKGAEGATAAAFVAGFAASGVGITLIVLGNRKRSAK